MHGPFFLSSDSVKLRNVLWGAVDIVANALEQYQAHLIGYEQFPDTQEKFSESRTFQQGL